MPLGIDRQVPEDRLRIVLQNIDTPKARTFFGVDVNGIELRADDIDWRFGAGTPLYGAAQDLLLVLCGRRLPAGRLRGEPSPTFYVALQIRDAALGLVADAEVQTGTAQRMLLSVDVEDVDRLLERVEALGGQVLGPPNDMPWGQRVAHIKDPDGNALNLTQPT